MKARIGFFEESPGVLSMTRLILFITIINASILTDSVLIFGLVTDGIKNVGSLVGSCIALFTGMTSVIATVKLLQKPKENEGNNRTTGEGS